MMVTGIPVPVAIMATVAPATIIAILGFLEFWTRFGRSAASLFARWSTGHDWIDRLRKIWTNGGCGCGGRSPANSGNRNQACQGKLGKHAPHE